MPDNITLLVALVVPVVLFVGLRINAVMVFLSLCLGEVLVRYVSDDANVMLNLFSSHQPGTVSKSTLQIALLLLPAVLTSVFMIFSMHGRMRVVLNVLPAAAASLLGILLAVPLLPPGLRHNLQAQDAWHYLIHAQALIVGVGALTSLLFLWMQRHHQSERRKR
ncbi:MAG TPA: hypothetical protein VMY99_01470 [Nevskiaceae bacterium]|nr:hypothetical protein [Nevskiaceae bacterium]